MTANSTMQSLFEAKSTKNKNIHLQKLLSVFQILNYLSHSTLKAEAKPEAL